MEVTRVTRNRFPFWSNVCKWKTSLLTFAFPFRTLVNPFAYGKRNKMQQWRKCANLRSMRDRMYVLWPRLLLIRYIKRLRSSVQMRQKRNKVNKKNKKENENRRKTTCGRWILSDRKLLAPLAKAKSFEELQYFLQNCQNFSEAEKILRNWENFSKTYPKNFSETFPTNKSCRSSTPSPKLRLLSQPIIEKFAQDLKTKRNRNKKVKESWIWTQIEIEK